MKLIDRVGERYNRLVVIERAANKSDKDNNARWLCQCDCGNTCIAYGGDLQREKFKSCGCLNAERNLKHGKSHSYVYKIWKSMIQRTSNPTGGGYKNYGARGITVSDEWKSFPAFYADVGDRPRGYSLERIDNDKGYSKENCKWATSSEQNNNKRNNHYVEFRGKRQTLTQWSRETGISVHALHTRLDELSWDVEKALTTPVKAYKPRSK